MDPRRLVILGIVAAISALIGVAAWWQRPAPEPARPGASPLISSETSPQPSDPVAAPADKVAPPAPSFDLARVERNGEAVIAGRAAPGSDVELLANGGVVDHTKANEAGEFVLSPPPFAPGDYQLTLRSGGVTSAKSITVSVPVPGKGDVLVVVGEPGKPSEIVEAGPPAPAPAKAPPAVSPAAKELAFAVAPELKLSAVEAEGGRLFVQGTGPAGVRVIIYLNNQPVANAVVGWDEKWSLMVEKGLDPGDYAVRVDQVGEDGKVTARAEVPFTSGASRRADPSSSSAPRTAAAEPSTGSRAATPDTAASEPPKADAESSSNIVVKALDTLKVQKGDNLWRISRRTYGHGVRYSTIYQANTTQIRNPNRIYPGQIFVMPPRT